MKAAFANQICRQMVGFAHDAKIALAIVVSIASALTVCWATGPFKDFGPETSVGSLRMRKSIRDVGVKLWKDERGASLLEYSILIGLITVGVVATVTNVGTWISGRWTALYNALVPPA